MFNLVTIIATKDRPDKVTDALDSVMKQSLLPDKIIVVGESQTDLPKIKSSSASIATPDIIPLINHRTKNLSGALNSALEKIIEGDIHEEETYVSFLDDDDSWEPDYLRECSRTAVAEDSDLVVTGIIRHETGGASAGRKQSVPTNLSSSSFLVANPHIQGSNLFVRLSSLLRAGGFDENLPSTTDRDVCIRLFDLGNLKVSYLDGHLVHHYALGESRISSFGSPRKRLGLIEFYRKYSCRMDSTQRDIFKDRAVRLFGCAESDFDLDYQVVTDEKAKSHLSSTVPRTEIPFDLVVGFTNSNFNSSRLLIQDLLNVFRVFRGRKKLVVCDNTEEPLLLKDFAKTMAKEIEVRIVEKDTFDRKASKGKFGKYYEIPDKRKGIAYGRTILHHHLYLEALDAPIDFILGRSVCDSPTTIILLGNRDCFMTESNASVTLSGLSLVAIIVTRLNKRNHLVCMREDHACCF